MTSLSISALKEPQFQDLEFIRNLTQNVQRAQVELAIDGLTPLNKLDATANVVGGYFAGVINCLRKQFEKSQADEIFDARLTTILLQYPDVLEAYKRFAELKKMHNTVKKCQEVEIALAAKKMAPIHIKKPIIEADSKAPEFPTEALCANPKCDQTKKVAARCSACKKVFYCGPKCQEMNWKEHKKVCLISKKK